MKVNYDIRVEISQEEFGKALGTGRANISKRIKNGSLLTWK